MPQILARIREHKVFSYHWTELKVYIPLTNQSIAILDRLIATYLNNKYNCNLIFVKIYCP